MEYEEVDMEAWVQALDPMKVPTAPTDTGGLSKFPTCWRWGRWLRDLDHARVDEGALFPAGSALLLKVRAIKSG